MFHQSHLDGNPVASEHHLPSSMPGMGADPAPADPTAAPPSIPAPLPLTSKLPFGITLKQLALAGGVAVLVFLVLRHVMKKK